jgi:hypothetical protein
MGRIPQITPDVGFLRNLAAVLLLGHFLRKYSQTGGRFAFGRSRTDNPRRGWGCRAASIPARSAEMDTLVHHDQ